MNAVENASAAVTAARQELDDAVEALATSEPAAWGEWIDAQVREFIRTQPGVLQSMDDAGRQKLKQSIEDRRSAQQLEIASHIRKMMSWTASDLASLRDTYEWQRSMESYSEPIARLLRSAGFEHSRDWNNGWLERPQVGELPALQTTHSNHSDFRRFTKAVTQLRRAEQDLEVATRNAEGDVALRDWDSI